MQTQSYGVAPRFLEGRYTVMKALHDVWIPNLIHAMFRISGSWAARILKRGYARSAGPASVLALQRFIIDGHTLHDLVLIPRPWQLYTWKKDLVHTLPLTLNKQIHRTLTFLVSQRPTPADIRYRPRNSLILSMGISPQHKRHRILGSSHFRVVQRSGRDWPSHVLTDVFGVWS